MQELHKATQPILELAAANTEARRALFTGARLEVALMAVPEGEETGAATFQDHDRVVVCVEGEAIAYIGETEDKLWPGDLAFIAAGTFHNIRNTGRGHLRLYAVEAPPEEGAERVVL